ncbi:MAG: 2-hydroxyacyl-CoA dehydratase family protein [Dehalococcoidia bacterium]
MEEKKEYIYAGLADGLRALGDQEEKDKNMIKADGYRYFADSFNRMAEAVDNGKPIAWVSVAVPPEIFIAMDIVPFCDPVAFGLLGALEGVIEGPMDLAKEVVPDYVCSTNRLPLGLILDGSVPPPTLMVTQNNPCDSILGLDTPMAKYFGIPIFHISTPHKNSEAGYKYVANEMKKAVKFIEEQTGRKLDPDRLREVMKYSNQAHEILLNLNQLTMKVPCPFTLQESMLDYALFLHDAGRPYLVDYMKKVYQITKDRVDGKRPYPIEEKLRLVWTYLVPAYDFVGGCFDYLEENYGAVSVTFMNENLVVKPGEDISTYDGMMMSLAKKSLMMPMSRECRGTMESYLDACLTMAREYQADGVIFAGHVGCKSNWAAAKVLKDAVQEELGIPALNFEMDVIDSRVAPTQSLLPKLEDFMPLVIESRKRRGAEKKKTEGRGKPD